MMAFQSNLSVFFPSQLGVFSSSVLLCSSHMEDKFAHYLNCTTEQSPSSIKLKGDCYKFCYLRVFQVPYSLQSLSPSVEICFSEVMKVEE